MYSFCFLLSASITQKQCTASQLHSSVQRGSVGNIYLPSRARGLVSDTHFLLHCDTVSGCSLIETNSSYMKPLTTRFVEVFSNLVTISGKTHGCLGSQMYFLFLPLSAPQSYCELVALRTRKGQHFLGSCKVHFGVNCN